MPPTKVGKLAPVTLGHMRSQGCRDLLVYCNSGRCNHSTIMNVGHLPDDTLSCRPELADARCQNAIEYLSPHIAIGLARHQAPSVGNTPCPARRRCGAH